MDKLIIKGAREHNLKNIDLELPRDKLIIISGLFETSSHRFPSPKAGWIFHIG
jgi:excinuclease UvrABC ATPase subunit